MQPVTTMYRNDLESEERQTARAASATLPALADAELAAHAGLEALNHSAIDSHVLCPRAQAADVLVEQMDGEAQKCLHRTRRLGVVIESSRLRRRTAWLRIRKTK